jgi:hypothetical protein
MLRQAPDRHSLDGAPSPPPPKCGVGISPPYSYSYFSPQPYTMQLEGSAGAGRGMRPAENRRPRTHITERPSTANPPKSDAIGCAASPRLPVSPSYWMRCLLAGSSCCWHSFGRVGLAQVVCVLQWPRVENLSWPPIAFNGWTM